MLWQSEIYTGGYDHYWQLGHGTADWHANASRQMKRLDHYGQLVHILFKYQILLLNRIKSCKLKYIKADQSMLVFDGAALYVKDSEAKRIEAEKQAGIKIHHPARPVDKRKFETF